VSRDYNYYSHGPKLMTPTRFNSLLNIFYDQRFSNEICLTRDISRQQIGDLNSLEAKLDLTLTQLHLKLQNEMTEQLAAIRKSIESITESNRSDQRRARSRFRSRLIHDLSSFRCFPARSFVSNLYREHPSLGQFVTHAQPYAWRALYR